MQIVINFNKVLGKYAINRLSLNKTINLSDLILV
jgi:hypothetical protein